MPDFQQTVNLKDNFLKQRAKTQPQAEPKTAVKDEARIVSKTVKRKAEEIDRVYNNQAEDGLDLKTFARPAVIAKNDHSAYKIATVILGVAFLAVSGYAFLYDRKSDSAGKVAGESEPSWYMVKLDNNEAYYGQIQDTAADPIVIKNVYYNYDQLNAPSSAEGEEAGGTGLRLVKRGKEAQGGDGSMAVVRAHVVSLEPLAEDSKVLKAILDYERQ